MAEGLEEAGAEEDGEAGGQKRAKLHIYSGKINSFVR